MRQFFGMSRQGSLREAVSGLVMPQMLLLMSNERQFEEHVRELEALFPVGDLIEIPFLDAEARCFDVPAPIGADRTLGPARCDNAPRVQHRPGGGDVVFLHKKLPLARYTARLYILFQYSTNRPRRYDKF